MITSAQSRAARGLLGWTQDHLAQAAGCGTSSVRYLETESREISDELKRAILEALEEGGVEFIPENGGGVGVRLKTREAKR